MIRGYIEEDPKKSEKDKDKEKEKDKEREKEKEKEKEKEATTHRWHLAQELLGIGLKNLPLRDEIFCQICKLLSHYFVTNNRNRYIPLFFSYRSPFRM